MHGRELQYRQTAAEGAEGSTVQAHAAASVSSSPAAHAVLTSELLYLCVVVLPDQRVVDGGVQREGVVRRVLRLQQTESQSRSSQRLSCDAARAACQCAAALTAVMGTRMNSRSSQSASAYSCSRRLTARLL